jgi:Uncharacterized conserved protein (COG2071)
MRVPVIRGVIDRRVLVNFRVEPSALAAVLPEPLRPKLVGGYGIGGICLIRLRDIRPRYFPSAFGISSENAAHRIAVQWDRDHDAVFIPRRDTSSWFNTLLGGRIFPGVHHRSRFYVTEDHPNYSIRIVDPAEAPILQIRASAVESLPSSTVFSSLADASSFFEAGSLGFSPSRQPDTLDALELRTHTWKMEPLSVTSVSSSFFGDPSRFPLGTVQFDSAFLMRHIEHEWHSREPLYCGQLRRVAL